MARDFRPGGDPAGGLYVAANPYPLARPDRGKGIPTNAQVAPSLSVPRVFLWSFHLRETGNPSRATVVSRRIVGPAFVDWLTMETSLSVATPNPVLGLGYSLSAPPEGSNQAAAALPTVVYLHEDDAVDDSGMAIQGEPTIWTNAGTAAAPFNTWRIGRPITAPEFFLVMTLRSASAGSSAVNGAVRVLENVDPDLLAELVLS